MLHWVFGVYEVRQRGEDCYFFTDILQLFGVLKKHIEGRRVAQINWFDQGLELLEGYYTPSIKADDLGDFLGVTVNLESRNELWLRKLFYRCGDDDG